MTENEMINKLRQTQKEHRFNHTMGVVKEAVRLAPKFGVDEEKARVAALLHDCAKNLDEKCGEEFNVICNKYGVKLDDCAKKERALVHACLGAAVAWKDYGVSDHEILEAIYYHTTARADEIRRLVEIDIDEALIYAIGCSVKHVIRKGTLIHPDSVHALNYLIAHRRAKQ